jgi:transcriptional regulator with XRE-family HTH domain
VFVGNSTDKIKDCFLILGSNISKCRKDRKMTLEELGFRIGLDKSAIFHIENGKPITITTLLKIAMAMEADVCIFFENFPKLKRKDLA